MNRQRSLYLVLILLSLLGTATSNAQVLECKDARGGKIYAQTCPKGTSLVREVEYLKASKEAPKNDSQVSKIQQQIQEWEQERKARAERAIEEQASDRDKQRALENKCHEDKKKLNALLLEGPYEVKKAADGSPIYIDDNQRLELIKSIGETLKKCPSD